MKMGVSAYVQQPPLQMNSRRVDGVVVIVFLSLWAQQPTLQMNSRCVDGVVVIVF